MRMVKGLVHRCLDVLEMMSVHGQWHRLSDIASALELPKGPVHRLLAELLVLGWVEQDAETERYRLTLKLALLGQQYLRGTGLPGVVQPVLDEAARRCRELVRLTVLHDNRLHWMAAAQGAPMGLMYQPSPNSRVSLHRTAVGKSWLATLDDALAVRLAVQGGLGERPLAGQVVGPRAITTPCELLEHLRATRARGFGLAVEEAEPGVKAMAVVVRSPDNQIVLGTLSIAGPLVRMVTEKEPALHDLLRQAAGTLSLVWPREMLQLCARNQDT